MSESRVGNFLKGVAPYAIVGGGVIFGLYELYQYMNAGLKGAEDSYKYWVQEIILETKDWYAANAKDEINGLLPDQKALLAWKQRNADDALQNYINQLESRNLPVINYTDALVYTACTAILGGTGAVIYKYLRPKVKVVITDDVMAYNTLVQIDFLANVVAYDFAYAGDVALASSIQSSLDAMYTTDFINSFNLQIATLTQQLASLTPGTIQYATVSNMLYFSQFALSTNALPAINYSLILPPVLP